MSAVYVVIFKELTEVNHEAGFILEYLVSLTSLYSV